MEALLGAGKTPQTQWGKALVKREAHPIPSRYYYVLALHLKGSTLEEISELSGYAVQTIQRILKSDDVITVRQQILATTQDEFEALFNDVVIAIRDALKYGEIDQKLQAAEKWLKAHGKYQPSSSQTINLTAEDVVFQILNQKVVNE
jgi:predicted transcriptional regulator